MSCFKYFCITTLVFLIAVGYILFTAIKWMDDNHHIYANAVPFLVPPVEELEWNNDTIPDLENRTYIVTGANKGLGFSTVKLLVSNNAEKVIMGCRSMERCEAARAKVLEEFGEHKKDNIICIHLDLEDLETVKKFSVEVYTKLTYLDGIVLNAGVMYSPFELTKDGIEKQFQVNHLGQFYLMDKLFTLLQQPNPEEQKDRGRYVTVITSHDSYFSYPCSLKDCMDFSPESVNRESDYDPVLQYGQTKMANLMFVRMLHDYTKNIGVTAVTPGIMRTAPRVQQIRKILEKYLDYFKSYSGITLYEPEEFDLLVEWFVDKLEEYQLLWNPDDSALNVLFGLTSSKIFDDFKYYQGAYLIPIGMTDRMPFQARSHFKQKMLWLVSQQLIMKRFTEEFEPSSELYKELWNFLQDRDPDVYGTINRNLRQVRAIKF